MGRCIQSRRWWDLDQRCNVRILVNASFLLKYFLCFTDQRITSKRILDCNRSWRMYWMGWSNWCGGVCWWQSMPRVRGVVRWMVDWVFVCMFVLFCNLCMLISFSPFMTIAETHLLLLTQWKFLMDSLSRTLSLFTLFAWRCDGFPYARDARAMAKASSDDPTRFTSRWGLWRTDTDNRGGGGGEDGSRKISSSFNWSARRITNNRRKTFFYPLPPFSWCGLQMAQRSLLTKIYK